MKFTLQDRLLYRELGEYSRRTSVKGFYGQRKWVEDLDIVNELGGHSGCVNALSWSKSGRLLASGSDDQHLSIHSYQPDSSTVPFMLTTTVATGHTANIFSVKFMPHSNDQTLVTCAGDGQVRVFDIEYSGRSTLLSDASNLASVRRTAVNESRRFNNIYHGVRYLSDGDTNARVYRSHADRVKRIVTESSPYLFLSCSEDGDVRQWDLRLPSSAYPPPRSRHDSSNVPPPLISYRRFQLDLNTISCSATQPHYIVLGGTHLHCFLHDRRMLGRDRITERGSPGSASSAGNMSECEDEMMGEATRCVRRFAPNGQTKMRRTGNGHVTACKISDANPNEMIASWSGDHIYSFDLVKSPDVRETNGILEGTMRTSEGKGKVKEPKNRRGKRRHADFSTSEEGIKRGSSQPRQSSDIALRIRYENGQSEDITIEARTDLGPQVPAEEMAPESSLSEAHRRSLKIAKSVSKIRKLMLSLDISTRGGDGYGAGDHSVHASLFSSALFEAAWCMPEMEDVMRGWRYPVSPSAVDVAVQKTLRNDRDSARRFVQAAGTLARVLGGQLRTTGGNSPVLRYFREIAPSSWEGVCDDTGQIFCYDFLKAILIWLDGGPQALLQGFKRPPDQRNISPRFPIPSEAQLSGLDDHLIPYLLDMARARPIFNVDASRFERDEFRKTFETETAAITAFSHAIRIPMEDLSTAVLPVSSSADGANTSAARAAAQDRNTALRYWGFKVGRGLLLNAGEISQIFPRIYQAFGGSDMPEGNVEDDGRTQEEVDPNDVDAAVHTVSVLNGTILENNDTVMEALRGEHSAGDNTIPAGPSSRQEGMSEQGSSELAILVGDLHSEIAHHMANGSGDEGTESHHEDEGDESDGDSDGDITAEESQFVWQRASDRGMLRESVQSHVPCVPSTRAYRGHCNIKTVKDVNYFGLQDEYVVSGSDSGHLFIWDKKTSQLLNILEGDGEVVNVVQGHPYEPMIAVSGIDHTIKIFSPDLQSQFDARNGINLGTSTTSSSGHSSLFMGRPRARRPQPAPPNANSRHDNEAETCSSNAGEADSEVDDLSTRNSGLASRKRIHESYKIISQNDAERQGGMRDAFIRRSVLAQLAARLRARRAQGGGEDGEDEVVVLDENCSVM
ncbi:hypothetical protein MMC30_000330 [Trapelia coarctata]|nr:hypothetical protein [Trapelia coarctata]